MTETATVQADVVTSARWFGPPERPLLGWLTHPRGYLPSAAVLMLGPVGYDYWTTHRTLRTVAERLAATDHAVLRFDYSGTGDSAGIGHREGQVSDWAESAAAGAAELRSLGCQHLTIVGTRLGGLLALDQGAALGAEAIVAWAPPASGKRFVREMRLMADPMPTEEEGVTASGWVFSPADMAELSELGVSPMETPPAPRVALVAAGGGTLAKALEGCGATVEILEPEGGETALEMPTEDATVPEAVVDALVAAVGPGNDERLAEPAEVPEAMIDWKGGAVRERVVRLGQIGMVGVLTTPSSGSADTVVVWLNSGSESHVGPGRAWVEYARSLAARGVAALRLDFTGWGESPDLGHAPGRPYDAHGVDDAITAVGALEEVGFERVVLAGLCSSSWIALQVVLQRPVAGVFALNPQLYWQRHHPVISTIREGRIARTPMREREERGARFGIWTMLDTLGQRGWAGRWLDRLNEIGTPVALCFAEGDEGLEFLRLRHSRRVARVTANRVVKVIEVPDIDHSMTRVWLRDRIVDAVAGFVDELPPAQA